MYKDLFKDVTYDFQKITDKEEISKILKISIGTVKSRISRTRNILKEKLLNEPYGLGKDE